MVNQESHLPQTVTQLAGHATSEIVGRMTPTAVGVIILNLVGIGAAVYFLNVLIIGQQHHLENLLNVQKSQITLVLATHDREFDALMSMIKQQLIPIEPPRPFLPPPRP